jgi:Di- and tripeptidases
MFATWRTPKLVSSSAEIQRVSGHAPMEKSDASGQLVELAQQAAMELGFALSDASTGGASDANTTSGLGLPTLDGLGPIGGDDHSADEWLDLASVVPRVTLLAGLIAICADRRSPAQHLRASTAREELLPGPSVIGAG